MTVRVTAVQILVVGMQGAGGTCGLPSCFGLVLDSSKLEKSCRNLILLQFPQFKVTFISFPNSDFRGEIIPYIRYIKKSSVLLEEQQENKYSKWHGQRKAEEKHERTITVISCNDMR